MPLTTVTPAAASPRPSARADLEPVRRRAARADDRHGWARLPAPAAAAARHVQHRGRVRRSRAAARDRRRRGGRRARRPAPRRRARAYVRRRTASRAEANHGRRTPAIAASDQLVVGQREELGPGAAVSRPLDAARAGHSRARRSSPRTRARHRGAGGATGPCRHVAAAPGAAAQRGAQMSLAPTRVAPGEVGDRARHLQHAPVPAGAQPAGVVGGARSVPGRRVEPHVRAHERGRCSALQVATSPQPPFLALAGAPPRSRACRGVVSAGAGEPAAYGRWTSTSRSIRSSSGPLSRRRCRARSASVQAQRCVFRRSRTGRGSSPPRA